jgi:hypothetical protein
MKRTSLVVAGFSAIVAFGLIGYGCTSGDTVNDGTGGKGTGGSTSGTGGSTTTTGTGGMTTTGTGGMTSTGTGGSTTTGTGGMTSTGTGGMTTTGVGGSSGGIPVCASPAPADKSMCTPGTDISPCTKNCGVKAEATQPRAQKPCVCNASTTTPPGAWDCTNAGPCVYPTTFNKTCFALTSAPPACPTPLPVSNVTTCTNTAGATCGPLCGSATAGSYTTGTSTTAKVGYCACINGIWQCASVNEWPM